MKARYFVGGLAIAVAFFLAGSLAIEYAFAQGKESRSEWQYKVVDLALQTPDDGSKALGALTIGDFGDVGKIQKAIEGLLNKNGAGGWELVCYSHTTAVYKRAVKT